MFDRRIQLPSYFLFLVRIFLAGIFIFFCFRIIFLFVHFQQAKTILTLPLLTGSILHGLQFDICISCYLLTLPFLILSAASFLKVIPQGIIRVSSIIIILFFSAAFFICASDIPYFAQFNSRLTTSALLWTDNPKFVVGMIAGDISYWGYIFPFLIASIVFSFLVRRFRINTALQKSDSINYFNRILFFVFTGGLLVLGMRGRIAEKSPIRVGTAFFSDNTFANQFALNPVFSFFSSLQEDMRPENKQIHLIPDEEAVSFSRSFFRTVDSYESPVARNIISVKPPRKMNVVVVIMESMSIYNMGKYGGTTGLTPSLDSLAKNNLFFGNVFTQGIHTFNGIYSSLFSFPALLKQQPMLKIPVKPYGGMPETLKRFNYHNVFFITHDGQFDNVEGFLRANGFDEVYSQADYPSEKILSTMGAPDDFMFEYSIPKLNELSSKGQNFFCGFMTGSNHHPFAFPDWVKINYHGKDENERMIEYADWSVGKFMKLASVQPWYKNTIFVFVADHGKSVSGAYDMPITYHHTPLIVCAPGLNLLPRTYDCLGCQMDIFPTVMGLMNYSYVNNTMGIDLLKEKRPFAFFTADDKIGCTDKDYFFIHRNDGTENLYRYKNLENTDLLQQYKAKADSMRTYSYSMLQTAQWVLREEKFR